MLLRTRSMFRRKYRTLILSVRLAMIATVLLAFMLAMSFSSDEEFDENLLESDNFGRHLLATVDTTRNKTSNCTPAAILEFPFDGLTREQRRSGWIAIHCLLACCSFALLAMVCDDYFVPAIEKMCKRLKMAEDVAGATFMAAASSSPELFINSVGTFVTEGDIGVGTIVGSAVFNVLAVPACCGLLAGQVVDLDWWSVSRDSMMYGVAVISLIVTLSDEKVQWYEATILVVAYILYILAMYFDGVFNRIARSACCRSKKKRPFTEITPLLKKDGIPNDINHIENQKLIDKTNNNEVEEKVDDHAEDPLPEIHSNIWRWPEEETACSKTFWVVSWPIAFILWLTIPNCKKYKKLYLLTFFMCVLWIGCTSYFVAWMITVIGDTLNIPDSVMGLTFLAAGTSVPEAVSSIIVTNKGHATMGISNSIGSNTFDILLCLGLPWFIKSVFYPTNPNEHWVKINSSGLTYSAISLLSTLFGLYISFICNKFRLDWKIGLTCTMMYIAFLTLASLIELNVFFEVNLPVCFH